MKTAKELLVLKEQGETINFLDIRKKEKYDSFHFPRATLIDREKLLANPKSFLKNDEKYYISCNGGHSATVIANTLRTQGFDIDSVKDGMNPLVNLKIKD